MFTLLALNSDLFNLKSAIHHSTLTDLITWSKSKISYFIVKDVWYKCITYKSFHACDDGHSALPQHDQSKEWVGILSECLWHWNKYISNVLPLKTNKTWAYIHLKIDPLYIYIYSWPFSLLEIFNLGGGECLIILANWGEVVTELVHCNVISGTNVPILRKL